LAGLTVLDLSNSISGGYCTKLLADLGARVIKIEDRGTGDSLRSTGSFLKDLPNPETSAPFLYLNAGKMSVTLCLESRGRQAILRELVKEADILVENFKPGYLAELELDYPCLEKVNPGLIMASISYFGQTGPYRNYEGCELVAYAVGGYMYLTGDADREPLKAGGSQSEYQAGLSAALAITAALNYRDHTGEGQYIDLSTVEATVATFDGVTLFTMWERQGIIPQRAGSRLVWRDPKGPYPSTTLPCKDGWVHVHYSPSNPKGLALLTANPRLQEKELLESMQAHADEIDSLISEWLKDYTKEEVQTLAQEIRVPFTKVQTIGEVMTDPQNEARGFFPEIEHPIAGKLKYPGSPFGVAQSALQPFRAPLLGEHNQEVYCQTLGYSREEMVRLREVGII
ncbi:MAG: CaiB/BaiF CoA transferase family protein, partial [Dehalococcoidia bacterium]